MTALDRWVVYGVVLTSIVWRDAAPPWLWVLVVLVVVRSRFYRIVVRPDSVAFTLGPGIWRRIARSDVVGARVETRWHGDWLELHVAGEWVHRWVRVPAGQGRHGGVDRFRPILEALGAATPEPDGRQA